MMLKSDSTLRATDLRGAGWSVIPAFLERNQQYLTGRVLDFGCGDQRYKKFVSGEYCPYDPHYPDVSKLPPGPFDSILITQVLQTVSNPFRVLGDLWEHLKPEGYWVVTYNASWYEVMPINPHSPDRWRFSQDGMVCLLGGKVLVSEPLVDVRFADFTLHMTYGMVVQRKSI